MQDLFKLRGMRMLPAERAKALGGRTIEEVLGVGG
jgi:hypothetical protein